jgi:hypothetical protein
MTTKVQEIILKEFIFETLNEGVWLDRAKGIAKLAAILGIPVADAKWWFNSGFREGMGHTFWKDFIADVSSAGVEGIGGAIITVAKGGRGKALGVGILLASVANTTSWYMGMHPLFSRDDADAWATAFSVLPMATVIGTAGAPLVKGRKFSTLSGLELFKELDKMTTQDLLEAHIHSRIVTTVGAGELTSVRRASQIVERIGEGDFYTGLRKLKVAAKTEVDEAKRIYDLYEETAETLNLDRVGLNLKIDPGGIDVAVLTNADDFSTVMGKDIGITGVDGADASLTFFKDRGGVTIEKISSNGDPEIIGRFRLDDVVEVVDNTEEIKKAKAKADHALEVWEGITSKLKTVSKIGKTANAVLDNMLPRMSRLYTRSFGPVFNKIGGADLPTGTKSIDLAPGIKDGEIFEEISGEVAKVRLMDSTVDDVLFSVEVPRLQGTTLSLGEDISTFYTFNAGLPSLTRPGLHKGETRFKGTVKDVQRVTDDGADVMRYTFSFAKRGEMAQANFTTYWAQLKTLTAAQKSQLALKLARHQFKIVTGQYNQGVEKDPSQTIEY